jgi:outer membrane protein
MNMFKSMSKFIIVLCVVFIGYIGFSANTFVQAADIKIGVVDLQRVIDASEEGKRAQAEVQKKGDELSQQVKAREEELQAMKADYEKQSLALTPEAKREKLDVLEKKDVEYQRFVKDAQADFRKVEQRALKELYDQIKQVTIKYGKDNNYSLIVEVQSVIYNSDIVDITEEIIKIFNSLPKQSGN